MNPAQQAPAFAGMVRDLTNKYHALWNGMPQGPPAFHRRFSPAEQGEKEAELERLSSTGVPTREAYQELPRQEQAALRARARTAAARLVSPSSSSDLLNGFFDGCERVTDEFVRMTDAFDPSIRDCDIHQALRNQWVFNSIQWMLGLPVTLTPSSFAYSLLYPYTDNVLDGALAGAAGKKSFLLWLSERLEGGGGPPPDRGTKTIAWLLRLIEEEFPRSAFPAVHASLRAIHRAQERSLRLHDPPTTPDESMLTPLTLEKGGTSVLVDGFLAAPRPEPATIDALFGYGVLLQLIDDLQDVQDDAAVGHSTPFVRAAGAGPLDTMTDRLLHFTRAVICVLRSIGRSPQSPIIGLIERSCLLQIQASVALHADHFTPSYLAALEQVTPLSFVFLRRNRRRSSEEDPDPAR